MTPSTVVLIAVALVAVVVAAGRGVDRRRARRPSAGALAAASASEPHAVPFPTWVAGLVMLAAAAGMIAAGVSIASTSSDAAQDRSDQLRSCSSSFSAELVTGPTASALQALARYGAGSPEFVKEVDKADPGRFRELAQMSRTDPAEFLRICRSADGAG